MSNIFQFFSEYNLPILLGKKAKNIGELLDGIGSVPGASIYYHTHRFLKTHHFLIPELPNDFAYWLRNVLNLKELGELVSSVNIVECMNLEQLRNGLNYQKLGAGVCLQKIASVASGVAAINSLLANDSYAGAAAELSRQASGYEQENAIEKVAERCLALLS